MNRFWNILRILVLRAAYGSCQFLLGFFPSPPPYVDHKARAVKTEARSRCYFNNHVLLFCSFRFSGVSFGWTVAPATGGNCGRRRSRLHRGFLACQWYNLWKRNWLCLGESNEIRWCWVVSSDWKNVFRLDQSCRGETTELWKLVCLVDKILFSTLGLVSSVAARAQFVFVLQRACRTRFSHSVQINYSIASRNAGHFLATVGSRLRGLISCGSSCGYFVMYERQDKWKYLLTENWRK